MMEAEKSPEEKFRAEIQAALGIGQEVALALGGQGAYEYAGKITMLCQAIRLVYTELEKVRALVPKDESTPTAAPSA
jgi:hypothetical protein